MNGGEQTTIGDVDDYLSNISYDKRRVDYARRSGRFILVNKGKPEIWVYMGSSGDYIIVDRIYCSCPGFSSRITREGVGGCTHIAALRGGLERFQTLDVGPDAVISIVMECMVFGRSTTLRRKIRS